MTFDAFTAQLAGPASHAAGSELDHVVAWARQGRGGATLDDDFSILKVQF